MRFWECFLPVSKFKRIAVLNRIKNKDNASIFNDFHATPIAQQRVNIMVPIWNMYFYFCVFAVLNYECQTQSSKKILKNKLGIAQNSMMWSTLNSTRQNKVRIDEIKNKLRWCQNMHNICSNKTKIEMGWSYSDNRRW